MIEIRWHGRGGQGAKTASLLLADAAFNTGKFIQGFPEYGPERMGAPMTAYNRIDENEIRIHSNVYEPDYVVVVDDTLIGTVDVTNGLKKEGAILVNTSEPIEKIRKELSGYTGKVYTLDATKISLECLKANFPNTALLAAIIKITNIMDRETLIKDMEGSFKHKFARKPEVIPPNMECLTRGFDELNGGE
ncbi:MAG: pyruvate/ketoisovalerate oxidoreductase, gamma subunit [Clostridia bacterium]|jgi:pyruvate ferredoxin oxidoreductase gamma subunit|nr:pyruvate/ketoisovalerate oxidoreductase, gamma subunit [Clostridia bacterium]